MAESKPNAADDQLENMIKQTIDLALMQKDAYLKEIETSNSIRSKIRMNLFLG